MMQSYQLNVVNGVITEGEKIANFFYFWPRFRIIEGSIVLNHVREFLKKNNIGDGIEKLKFRGEYFFKYKNGICFVFLYCSKEEGFKIEDYATKHIIISSIPKSFGCMSCNNLESKMMCGVWGFKIINKDFICDFWEENLLGV